MQTAQVAARGVQPTTVLNAQSVNLATCVMPTILTASVSNYHCRQRPHHHRLHENSRVIGYYKLYYTVRCNTLYLTCSLNSWRIASLVYHTERTKNVKRIKTKNKLMSMISPFQSHCHEGSPMSKEETLSWEGFVENVGFEPGVKE